MYLLLPLTHGLAMLCFWTRAKCSLMSQIAVMFECVVVIADFSLVYEHVIHSGQTGIW